MKTRLSERKTTSTPVLFLQILKWNPNISNFLWSGEKAPDCKNNTGIHLWWQMCNALILLFRRNCYTIRSKNKYLCSIDKCLVIKLSRKALKIILYRRKVVLKRLTFYFHVWFFLFSNIYRTSLFPLYKVGVAL